MKNKSFEKMTAAEKRVAIARDAVKQIELHRFKISMGRYFQWKGPDCKNMVDQPQLLSKTAKCEVCQLGATMASAVRLFNQETLSDNGSHTEKVFGILIRWFERQQLVLMEGCFEKEENWISHNWEPISEEQFLAVKLFRKKHRSNKARSLAIFENIIKNCGEFKP